MVDSQTRYVAYALLIITAVGTMLGRIASVQSKRGATPFLSANDRSRWCTIRALVDHGTYAIDQVIFTKTGKRDPEWSSIDVVKHRGSDGREHFYSSKPTLLPTLLAAEYWLIKKVTGATLQDEPFYVGRWMLVLNNILPLVGYFLLLIYLVEQLGKTDWGKLFVIASATWATFITTFAITLNNHTIAAVSALAALAAAWRVWREKENASWIWYFIGGGSAAFTAVNELPAMSLFAALTAAMTWRSPRRALLAFLPPAIVIGGVSILTNYLAHDTWKPAYAQRYDGVLLGHLPDNATQQLDQKLVPNELAEELSRHQRPNGLDVKVTVVQPGRRWSILDEASQQRFTVVRAQSGLELRLSHNWYEYEGSYWLDGVRAGVDRGEPNHLRYAFHVLIGHHGVLSLTPIWLFAAAGLIRSLSSYNEFRAIAALTALLTMLCVVFFLLRPLEDRNYGGVASGFRWLFWLIPLWLLFLIPAMDAIATSRRWRIIAVASLLMSTFSAAYANLNPWSHPWLYQYWSDLGWVVE